MNGPAIGIDLGTTYSVIAHLTSDGRPEVLRHPKSGSSVPSVMHCGEDPPLVGKAAKQMQAFGETDVAAFFKRSIGNPEFILYMGGAIGPPFFRIPSEDLVFDTSAVERANTVMAFAIPL